jgi:hypothetical protein
VRATDLDCCAQTVVGVIGRHLDVDDRDVGTVRRNLALQVHSVPRLGDDLKAAVGQQPAQALA